MQKAPGQTDHLKGHRTWRVMECPAMQTGWGQGLKKAGRFTVQPAESDRLTGGCVRGGDAEGRPSGRGLSGLCFIFLVCFQITEQINRCVGQTMASWHVAKRRAACGGPAVSSLLRVVWGDTAPGTLGRIRALSSSPPRGASGQPRSRMAATNPSYSLILEPP